MAIAATAATLAPSTADVRLCHGTGGASRWASWLRSRVVTATDSSGGPGTNVGSAELSNDLVGEEVDVLQIGHVEKLQIDALNAGLDEGAQLVDDLGRRPHCR